MTLTEAQATSKIPSKLLLYLNNKSKVESSLITANPAFASSFPTVWTDPSILSRTNAYEITRQGRIPDVFEEIVGKASHSVIRSYSDLDTKLIILGDSKAIQIYRHLSESIKQTKHITVSDLSHNKSSPLFDVVINDNQCIKMMVIGIAGKIRYYPNALEDHYIQHQLPVLAGEYMTSVKFINAAHAVVGSSAGEIYSLNLEGDSITMSTFYRHKLSFIKYFSTKPMPHLSEALPLPQSPSRAINSIRVVADLCYITDRETVSIWQIEDTNTAKLLLRKNLENDITNNVANHVPSQISKNHIQCTIIDMDVITKGEIVILASYSVPDMGDYVQYATIKFILEDDHDELIMYVKHTASTPFSAVPSTLKKLPRLNITDDIGFISFDKTVIATSLDRKSVFEESVVLSDPEDAVLCINLLKNPTTHIDCAIILTTKNNVLKYQIDTKQIQEPRTTGNMYAGVVENVLERDTMVFKSRLTQAIFFGTSNDLPIQFPLRVEQEDVRTAAMSLSRDIKAGQCDLIPASLNFELLVESRYYFEKRIYKVLKQNMLLDLLSLEDQLELLTDAENYFICIVLWEYFEQRIGDIYLQQAIGLIIQSMTKSFNNDMAPLQGFLKSQAFRTKELLTQIRFYQSGTKDEASWINYAVDIIMYVIRKAHQFEEKYIVQYDLQKGQTQLISADLCNLLIDILKQNMHSIKELAVSKDFLSLDDETQKSIGNGQTMPKTKLIESAKVLLDTLKTVSSRQNVSIPTYQTARKLVIENLCSIGQYEQAMCLAEEHGDIPCVVESVQKCQFSAEDIKSKNIYYIKLFGKEYFASLLQYLYNQEQRSMVTELSMQFSDLASEFFEEIFLPRVSWIYYLKTKQFVKSMDALEQCLATTNNLTTEELEELKSWHTMISAVLKENSASN